MKNKIFKDQWWRGIKEKQRGWTQESYRRAWESLGGDFYSVVDAVSDWTDTPEAYAAWLHYMAFGKWPREKEAESAAVFDDDEMKELTVKILREKGIKIPHPQTRLGSETGSVWKPINDVSSARVVSSGSGALILGKSIYLKDIDIPFEFYADIEKVEEKEGKYYLVGIASDTRIDKDEEVISENALKEMMEEIKKGNVVLLPSHKSDWDEEMGKVIDAEITPDKQLKIVAELDMENEKSQKLVKAIKKGKQLGLSIGGTVKRVYQKFLEGVNKVVKVIDSLVLKHIAVTGRPANPRTWLTVISKSIDKEVKKYMIEIKKQVEEQELTVSPDEALEELKEAIKEGDAEAIAEARKKLKEAIKKALKKEGMDEDEAEKEAEARCKEAEAKIRKESESESEGEGKKTLTLRLTKEQYLKVKKILDEESAKSNPVYNVVKEEIAKISKEIDEIKKMLSERKSKFITKEEGAEIEKIQKEFKERVEKSKNIADIDNAFKETLRKYLNIE